MNKYRVTVRTKTQRFTFEAIGASSWDVYESTQEKFGLCAVSVHTL